MNSLDLSEYFRILDENPEARKAQLRAVIEPWEKIQFRPRSREEENRGDPDAFKEKFGHWGSS
ncbi:MAG: hypothetical protein PHW75_02865 [Patescibacteria group bacterium]|nr:hypothetical protein [Patescibacteria group bacterium]